MNTGRGIYYSMQANVNKRLNRGLSVISNYPHSRLMDNNTTSVINPRPYRALSTFATGSPLSVTHPNGRPIRLRNPALSGPASERWGDQRNAQGQITNPDFDTGARLAYAWPFVVPAEPPRLDELRSPPTRSLNLNLLKTIPIVERFKLELRLEGSGVTNTPNFNAPGTNLNALATFGVITGAGGNRSMQGAIRLIF